MSDHSKDEPEYHDLTVPTRELERQNRKIAYEEAKKQRHKQKQKMKETRQSKRQQSKQKRDEDLWNLIRPASECVEPQEK